MPQKRSSPVEYLKVVARVTFYWYIPKCPGKVLSYESLISPGCLGYAKGAEGINPIQREPPSPGSGGNTGVSVVANPARRSIS